jgi:subtilase family serine protease
VSVAALALLAFTSLSAFALPARNVPSGAALGSDLGRVDTSQQVNLTVVLKLHNEAAFDKLVEDLYDPASSRFHQWLTDEELEQFAPTKQEYETVKTELTRQGFSVLSNDPQRLTLRVHGTAGTVEKAFQTELHNFTYNGKTFQAHIRDAQLSGTAGDLVTAVSGIERHKSQPQLSYVKNPLTGKPVVKKLLATKQDLSAFAASLTDAPLTVSAIENYGTSLPVSQFTGLQYAANGLTGAFTPAQLQAHYGVPFTQNSVTYDGTGQTIALVEAFGYDNAKKDANTAASLFGLSKLTSNNFSVIYPEGKPEASDAAWLTGWDTEIALDLQSAHAIAPGAKIVVVASAGEDNEDQIASLTYIISNKVANTVSSSWENDDEIISGKLEEDAFNAVLKTGAAKGVSFQFSSGDSGDEGLGTPVEAVSVPSNSPYATAVGGTSVLNNPYATNGQIVTGWGNDVVYLYDYGVIDPLEGYFNGGAGGGQSRYFAKPTWQSSLPGTWRQVPDVAALADPYTGFPLVLTSGSSQYGYVYGGTSLASPIFTATWAIAQQYNGGALGQAARAVSKLTTGHITDVVPPPTSINKYDVTGTLVDSQGTTTFTAATLFTDAENLETDSGNLSLYSQSKFLSAVYPKSWDISSLDVAISFGTDTSLTVAKGWDDVTGWGEPNGLSFVQGVTGKTKGAKATK